MVFITAIENVSSDLATAELSDLSQYGGSNPDRNELALYAYLYKRDAQNNDTQITLNNDNPTTVAAWSFTLPAADGVFVAIIFGFYIWSAGTYPSGTCRYHSGAYYKSNTSTSSTPGTDGTWDVISDILAECTGNATVEQTQTYNWSAARSSSGPIGDALADLGPKIIRGKCRDWNDAAQVLQGAGMINSAYMNFLRGDYQDAQSVIDFVQANMAA